MADSLGDLLRDYDIDEPPEIRRLKEYIRRHFDVEARLAIHNNQIVIAVPSAALAGTLRMHLMDLQNAARTKQRLIIRIG